MGNSPSEATITHEGRDGEDRAAAAHTIMATGDETHEDDCTRDHRPGGHRGRCHRLFLLASGPLMPEYQLVI